MRYTHNPHSLNGKWPRIRGALTPRAWRRFVEEVRLQDKFRQTDCMWPNCERMFSESLGLPFCDPHAQDIHDRVQANASPPRSRNQKRCIWVDCESKPFVDDHPLCTHHISEVHKFAEDLRWNETREDAITRGRRQEAGLRRSRKVDIYEDRIYATRGNQPGWIYYLHINNMVKIGYTTDIIRRMRDYPPNSPLLGVHPGTPELEKQFHEIFKGSLTQGREWFRPDPDVLAHCEKVVAEYGDPAQFEHRTLAGHETRQVIGTRNRR